MSQGLFLFFILLIIATIGQSAADTLNERIDPVGNQFAVPADVHDSQIPVGILVMQSGFISDIGTEYQRVFKMVKQDNPDSKILPIIMDGGSEASVASSSWEKMMSAHPALPVVVTVASWTTNVVYPDAADAGMVQLALGSAVVNRSRSSDHLIRFTPGVEQESPVLASYLHNFNRIAILGGDNDYTWGYISALDTLLPGKIILKSVYNSNNPESTLNITEVEQADPDVLVLLSVSEGGKVAELIRKAGITAPLVGTRVIERNSLLETPASEGLIFTTPALNTSHPFFARYLDGYGENATFYGAEGFDALTTLYSAVAECGGSSECISHWYENRSFNGTLGTVRFDKTGVAFYPIKWETIRNGRYEDYSPEITGS